MSVLLCLNDEGRRYSLGHNQTKGWQDTGEQFSIATLGGVLSHYTLFPQLR